MHKLLIPVVLTAAAVPLLAVQPYSSATLGIINSSNTAIDKATSISNPSPALAAGGIGRGQVGGNSATLASGNSRYFCQAAAFRVSDLLAALGTSNLADLANYTFTYTGVTEASTVDIADASIYQAAYAGQWEDTGAAYTDVPLRTTVADSNSQNMGGTPSATNASRTLFCNAGDAVSGFGGAAPVQTVNLGVFDLASTAQTLTATGFDLAGLATSLAADTDLSNNYVFFVFYLNPKIAVGTAAAQNFTSVNLVPVEKAAKTIGSGVYEVAGPNHADYWGLGAGLTQNGGTLRFEIDASGQDKLLVTGNYTQTAGDMAVSLTTRPVVGTPVPLLAYSGAMAGAPAISLEAGTRFSLAATSLGGGSNDAVSVTFGGSAASLYWTGANGPAWDLMTSENWVTAEPPDAPAKFFTADDVTFDDGTGTAPILSFSPTLATTIYPFSVKFNNAANEYTLGGAGGIGGGATFSQTGAGKVTILANNTHTGANSVTTAASVLQLGNGGLTGSLGTGPLALTGELILNRADSVVFPNNITGSGSAAKVTQTSATVTVTGSLAGTLSYNLGVGNSLRVGNGGFTGGLDATTVTVSVPATSAVVFNRADTSELDVKGVLSGAGSVTFKGSGVLNQAAYSPSGNNTPFTGTMTVDGARLRIDNTTDLGTAAGIAVLANSQVFVSASIARPLTLQGDGWLETAGRLGALRVSTGTTTSPITLAGNARIGCIGATATLSGSITDAGAARSLELLNNSTTADSSLTLSGPASDYSGGTTIRGLACTAAHANALGLGPVTVEAHPTTPARNSNLTCGTSTTPITIANPVTVKTSGSLFGWGGTSGAVNVEGGTLSPGPAVGTTTGTLATGTLNFKAGGILKADFNSSLATPSADRVNVTGGVTIDPAAVLNLADSATTKKALASGTKFVVLDYTGGSLSGTFSGKPQGTQVIDGPNTFTLDYADTTDAAGAPGQFVTVKIGTAYDFWAAANGLTGAAGREKGFYDDPEKDGLANGLEWILGGNPLVADAGTLGHVSGSAASGLTLTFNRADAAVGLATLAVQWGTTLNGPWNTVVVGATSSGPDANNVTVTINPTPSPDAVMVVIPAGNAPGGSLFARLRATLP